MSHQVYTICNHKLRHDRYIVNGVHKPTIHAPDTTSAASENHQILGFLLPTSPNHHLDGEKKHVTETRLFFCGLVAIAIHLNIS